ncbi:hypothetical protein L9F63_012580 [Diploptera punctata]|uniref:Phosphatidylcholine transfer protein n=1 Tax=Diploptera punctata TaxID=6984 RepID=A0AAD8ADL5_DIPPU|nr:hypothetical protein L9F63_012580 [Diploptera punctata]
MDFWVKKIHDGFLKLYSSLTKNVGGKRTFSIEELFCKSVNPVHNSSILHYVKTSFEKFPLTLKEQSVNIVKVCTQQCECVLAHRIRRGHQMFSLYTRLWDEVALKELLRKMRQQLSKRGKEVLFSAVGISVYNWEKERISDQELYGHLDEIQHIYRLREKTVTCPECRKRTVIDSPLSNIDYCSCGNDKNCVNNSVHDWQPFLEREDILVWRKECDQCQGLYIYKVYGRYEEITAEDFMKVQVDTDFRMLWDNTAVNLKVVEKDTCSNSDIVYWEMQWPRLFSNRDYVYNRRYLIDEEKNTIVIINKGTNHPNIPTKPDNHRVTDYWSIMVIRADNSIDKPGMEFSLTYFDNPGVSVPSSVATWIAMSGLPDFQIRLRQAARDYKLYNHDIEFNRPKEDNLGSSQPTPVPEQPVPTQVNASNSSLMYLKQFHVWQLFV